MIIVIRRLMTAAAKVAIVSAKRSPIGSFMGSLSQLSPLYLASCVVKGNLVQAKLVSKQVDEVIVAQALQAGFGQALGKQVCFNSDLPDSVSTFNVNKSCASGLKAIALACQSALLGTSSVSVALGIEIMSLAPFCLPNNRNLNLIGDGNLTDLLLQEASLCPSTQAFTGKVAEGTALKYEITRKEQDTYSLESYARARLALASQYFLRESLKIEIPSKNEDGKYVKEDEEVRKMDSKALQTLRTLYDKDGTITAGNSAKFADGAAAVICMTEDKANLLGISKIGRVLSYADWQTEPEHFCESNHLAVQLALNKAGLRVDQVDLFEINESFSVSVLAFQKLTGVERGKINVNGGALALGHPAGMTGVRMVSTLIYSLIDIGGGIGVASACYAGGGAFAIVVEVG